MPVEIGKVVEGTVTSITSFGAFIQLSEGKTGLCHISEVADGYVKDIASHLQENQKVKVKIIGLDEKGKISLSIRKAMPNTNSNNSNATSGNRPKRFKKQDGPQWKKKPQERALSFEDKLSQFLKDSDEKQQSMKKSMKSSRRSNGHGAKRSS
ncbi:MAG: S1 RNA-binding domain-containing protein [Anaeromicrobium sp.]|jgi:S1 RNA binding domain protein|uniref:S1 RNA-binding domain-containing protein n=1 Tax=Anaeromicrobium sp. TaxID=1929132 RepID=UPI0025F1C430|nr:S1 RNA-binding domain-containing protein [Anaeromicrobium sp.]MCT4594053.1 S1 RNA-binding domain-containing protein [Anaeromicrobium sp.]